MPFLSPSALRIAMPSAIPVSSMVWWESTYKSPFTVAFKSKSPCLAKLFSIWSKKPMPVSIVVTPVPSMLNSILISVSFVFRVITDFRFAISLSLPQNPTALSFAALFSNLLILYTFIRLSACYCSNLTRIEFACAVNFSASANAITSL